MLPSEQGQVCHRLLQSWLVFLFPRSWDVSAAEPQPLTPVGLHICCLWPRFWEWLLFWAGGSSVRTFPCPGPAGNVQESEPAEQLLPLGVSQSWGLSLLPDLN